jgi:hypothetical protein
VIRGKGVRRSWRWQLPRVRLSGPSGFGAASGATFRRGSRKRFLRRRDSWCRRGLTSNSTAFCSSSPLEWGGGRGPYGSSIRPEVIAAAVRLLGAEVVVAAALRAAASHPSAFCCSAGPPIVGGCSYLRRWNRSSVCNGTLSAGVCSLWLSGPEHVCIFGTEPCFSSFRVLGLAYRLTEPLNQV